MAKRDTYKYELHDGHRTVYVGTTNDPERREATSEGASKWEEERIDTYKPIMVVIGLSTIRMIRASNHLQGNGPSLEMDRVKLRNHSRRKQKKTL